MHLILDPAQSSAWHSIGIANLHRAGLKCFEFLEEGSEFVLPRLAQTQSGTFDLIFVDGVHLFDHATVDCFYATRLLRVGGFLLIDDADYGGISQIIARLETYPCYSRHGAVSFNPTFGLKYRAAARVVKMLPTSVLRHLSRRFRDMTITHHTLVALQKRAEDARPWDWDK
jgi:hypothetical protein